MNNDNNQIQVDFQQISDDSQDFTVQYGGVAQDDLEQRETQSLEIIQEENQFIQALSRYQRFKTFICSSKFQQNFNRFVHIALPITLVASFFIMRASIKDCPYRQQQSCAQFVNQLVKSQMIIYSEIGFLFSLTFILSISKKIDKKIGLFALLELIFIVFFYDNGVSLTHYGGAITNLIGIFTFLWFFGTIVGWGLLQCFQKNWLATLILIILSGYLSVKFLENQCSTWSQGLGDQKLIQTTQNCKVIIPKYCPMAIISLIINGSPILKKCETSKGNKDLYFNYYTNIDKMERYITFKNTNEFSETERICQIIDKSDLQFNVFKYAHNVKSPEEAFQQKQEIVLDLEEMKYIFQVQRDAALVESRIQNQTIHNDFSQKVMVIYIDALSRANFHRNMPQTAAWLLNRERQGFAKNVEFFRMYSLKPFTYPNFQAFQFEYAALDQEFSFDGFPCGNLVLIPEEKRNQSTNPYDNYIDVSQYSKKCMEVYWKFNDRRFYYIDVINRMRRKERNFFKDLQNAGYVIGRTVGMCMSNMATVIDVHPHYFWDEPADHEGLSFACDPNYEDPYFNFGLLNGPYSILKRCLNGKTVSGHMLEYGRQFWESYANDRAFMLFEFIDAHEPSGSVVGYLDDILVEFLNDLDSKKLLDDTLIMLMSDHGNHMHFVQSISKTQQFSTERMLPAFILSFPDRFIKQNPELYSNVVSNQQQMFTHQNTHFFIMSWIKGTHYEYYNRSFFNPEFNQYRNCTHAVQDLDQMYKNYGYDNICVCIDQDAPYPDPPKLPQDVSSTPSSPP